MPDVNIPTTLPGTIVMCRKGYETKQFETLDEISEQTMGLLRHISACKARAEHRNI
jgi:hypothetical protein